MIAIDVGCALEYLGERRIVHGNVNPHHFLLKNANGAAKLCDFKTFRRHIDDAEEVLHKEDITERDSVWAAPEIILTAQKATKKRHNALLLTSIIREILGKSP